MKSVTIIVPFLAPSTNEIYSGSHWSKRKALKNQATQAVMVACAEYRKALSQVSAPVIIQTIGLLGKSVRSFDISNYSYNHKLIEDGLVKCGVIPDDTQKYVKGMNIRPPERIGGAHSSTRVEIFYDLD
ncbi:MAG: hypothetical protein KAJ19_29335 [Gammaproteobacteria bacterium]|nr:hypothetical protein [Gammaproteobacteria bacterium]